jgi:thiosulfate reductase/polysulfide reductase chain A
LPDPEAFKKALDELDLLLSIDVNWSEIGWDADVVLPEATYLERTDNIIVRKGLKPKLALRKQAVEPLYDSKPRWWIFKALADRLGFGEHFPYETIDDHLAWQLAETGFRPEDFKATGEIALSHEEVWFDRADGLKFGTPSGKIELTSSLLEESNIPSWIPYESPPSLSENEFRLITGKTALHTQGRTTANNPLLNEIIGENKVLMHTKRAKQLGVETGDQVELSVPGYTATGPVKVTEFIHPEVVYMLHGFGDTVPLRTRSCGKGFSDARLAQGKLKAGVGGNCPLTDTVVTIVKANGQIES